MSRNRKSAAAKALSEVAALKAKRRKDIIKCAAALALILILVYVKLLLEVNGIIATGNMVAGALMMAATIGLAILGGTASIDFTKSGNLIKELCHTYNLSKEDIKNYDRG